MQNTITQLKPARQANLQYVATVSDMENGEAIAVHVDGFDCDLVVVGHDTNLPPLNIGDHVIVLHTDVGAIVTSRLRQPGEGPTTAFRIREDGSLEVHAQHGIVIRTDTARLEIRQDGRVFVDGKEIYAIADGLHRLQGATIELN